MKQPKKTSKQHNCLLRVGLARREHTQKHREDIYNVKQNNTETRK